ncbi:MAG: PaaI family thioesterase [Mycobacterium sp.]|uniref:Acyl-coenzyme A thioesterase THEM4 n=1 Tax=Mycobacterium gordonae TaxID=1778 RepID=A0A1A6BHD8_MYCGO|nr:MULTISPECIES: PaaI family thioesterase [Mycobacterium]MBX9979081.1 PaaI family thioesterase [Mycobacterium gordonae]MCQ4363006.1 PaaI family thioesterase [Mycobacterium gordonae]OBS01750.1 thioesterase [Mycobacterium gordonae]PJE11163.1 MAG: PaaI family thioesterase [Mycobacterium sp.]PJE15747.1 MAG: PaaI family thioesterase [Mycobacterium sp.]
MTQDAGALGALFEVLSASEADRVTALYAPLADAVRDLLDATVRTEVDDDTVAQARAAIEAVTQSLRQRTRPVGVSYRVDGRPLPLGNAVVGACNPIAPPLVVHHDGGGRCWADFVLGSAYEGPPKLVHGGVSALVLDHMLGEAASEGLSKARFTGTITVKYLRGTPLGPLRSEAWIDRREGRKVFARGFISDAAGITVESEGVFIEPSWVREGGNGQ